MLLRRIQVNYSAVDLESIESRLVARPANNTVDQYLRGHRLHNVERGVGINHPNEFQSSLVEKRLEFLLAAF